MTTLAEFELQAALEIASAQACGVVRLKTLLNQLNIASFAWQGQRDQAKQQVDVVLPMAVFGKCSRRTPTAFAFHGEVIVPWCRILEPGRDADDVAHVRTGEKELKFQRVQVIVGGFGAESVEGEGHQRLYDALCSNWQRLHVEPYPNSDPCVVPAPFLPWPRHLEWESTPGERGQRERFADLYRIVRLRRAARGDQPLRLSLPRKPRSS